MTMESEGVSLPLIHDHLLVPYNDLRRGDCCAELEAISDGYYCKLCNSFFHKKCCESSEYIQHPSHPAHTLRLRQGKKKSNCDICGRTITNLCYYCEICDFGIEKHCAKLPEVIDDSERHHHKLTLLEENTKFDCANCGKDGYRFSYGCHECDLAFHVDCVWHPPKKATYLSEINHSYHSVHPLKLLMGERPRYSDGTCRLCGNDIDYYFYHCSLCNFTVDLDCVFHPPSQSLLDLKVHDHQLTLLPRLDSFTCNACGLKGDRSPYVCLPCGFMIHQKCLRLPRVININRHDHRISRTSVLGFVNSICGVCRKTVDWTLGGYSCQKCPSYVVHSKCATRRDVWNGKELEGVPEEIEDIAPYVVIDDNTIQHFSHKEHYLILNSKGLLYEDNKRCNACTQPISLQSFYWCVDCDFNLHKNCAEFPKKIWHMLHNDRLTLLPNEFEFKCDNCGEYSNGFMYEHGDRIIDVRCSSISEPFVHPSHPQHPLYCIPKDAFTMEKCNGCKQSTRTVLKCIKVGCKFLLDFKCALLPQVVKHRVHDHPLSLCYGENANGEYWCDICEHKINLTRWFYTCKDRQASLHVRCVLGDFPCLIPGRTIIIWEKLFEVVLNNSVSRPICSRCNSHCFYPVFMRMLETTDVYLCSIDCAFCF